MDQPLLNDLFALDRAHVLHPNHPVHQDIDFIVSRGEGVRLYDTTGRSFIDGRSQLNCVNLGYGYRRLVDAIKAQAEELSYLSIFYQFSHPQVITCAARLAASAPGDLDHVLFTSGGSEAMEAALAMVRLYWSRLGRAKTKIISRYKGYHGGTASAMAATGMAMGGQTSIQRLISGHVHIPAPNLYRSGAGMDPEAYAKLAADQLAEAIELEGPDSVAAFLAEPIIGVGGYVPPPPGYWPLVREICDRYGVLLILDEVMTGFHRTGPRFAADNWGLVPDILVAGKGINSCYVPCGAAIVSRRIVDVLAGARLSGFTHSGHPLAMAAANAAFDAYDQDGIEDNVGRIHRLMMDRLQGEFLALPHVGTVEGLGLMIGLELVAEKKERTRLPDKVTQGVVGKSLDQGLIIRARDGRLALCPPLVISEAEANEMLDILFPLIRDMNA
ncbi:aspartate aminotransferase family protein [Mesorhizobium loti]|nr:aminotransferase class III-fold pyridoxal phosphate-dependent enzyme [Mesorhizobium loti]PLP59070.1 aspartate aminotransferase family protein [Mesorhizobium loti]